jgi:beta-lactam-binding protein with PASTA domain/predicted Ser/Thr protein kinase
MKLMEGDVVDGRYRIRSKIGSGGMADVWLADDLELSRQVALKVLHPEYAGDPAFIERFRREAEAAAGLQHNNIVPIFDRGQVDGTWYIAMAFIHGRTLRELIDQGLTVGQSVAIVRQVLEAAAFAHRNGVIHRDFKPMNVLVEDSGRVLVTDFGIARAGEGETGDDGFILGTPGYLSPEQADGGEIGPPSDLYSIGVILYECLTGRRPFPGNEHAQVALRQVTEQPEAPSHLNPEVSPALDAVVATALAREPYARFRSAEEFIAALDQAELDPTGGSPYEDDDGNRRRLIIGALALLLAALVAFGLLRDKSVLVPDVTGQSRARATERLDRAGFEVDQVSRIPSPRPKGTVVRQDPEGEASKDCAVVGYFCSNPGVELFVSSGPAVVEIPDVAGLSRDDAEEQLEKAGFEVSVERERSDDYPRGRAVGTDPPAGESAQAGSTVTLIISSGAATVAVPAVVGLTLEAARQRLAAKDLELSSTEEASSRPEGEVTGQSPDAGTRVAPGSTIELTVSSGEPAGVTLPNLVGQLRKDAVGTLRGLGLVPVVVQQETTIEPQDGRVIDQSPSGGATVSSGSSVTLTVGVFPR